MNVHELEVLANALTGMGDRPRNLDQALAFHSEQSDAEVALDSVRIAGHISNAGVDDRAIQLLMRALTRWDYREGEDDDWTNQTARNTFERRNRIYDLLQAVPELEAAIRDRIPPWLPTERLVVIAEEHERWYNGGQTSPTSFYWDAYSRYLSEIMNWREESIQELDRATTEILERLSSPSRPEQFRSKGLVVGYVQSGKTANFTGLLAKAADAGYRLFIVLAGTLDLLRSQTQRRIDKELIGRELVGEDYLTDDEWERFQSHQRRPSELGEFDWYRLTGPEDDYRSLRRGIESLEFHKADGTRPFYDASNLRTAPARIMVIKKNPTRIRNVARDLALIRARLEEIPALVIDDESDQASLNTLRPTPADQRRRTGTNGAITDLLEQLPRAQYVGYTATPFANVFVNPDDAQDLFPKDFIVALPRPAQYMGASDFHDLAGEIPDDFSSNERAYVRNVNGQDFAPENLLRAIDFFVLSGAVKLFREANDTRFAFQHHTMLVHVSHLIADQERLAARINDLIDNAGYYAGDGLARLERLFADDLMPVSQARNSESYPSPQSFNDLRPFLGECLRRIGEHGRRVLIVNGAHNDDTPDFDRRRVWNILVGGTKLSRGYTIEGLTVSYYRRTARAADTLMQMGRWFGYRYGYRDLVRLFIGRDELINQRERIDLYAAFEAVCRDEMDFRAQLDRYSLPEEGRPITPAQVPPLVPARLLRPTATNKMFNAVVRYQNFGGLWTDPTLMPSRAEDVAFNQSLVRNMVADRELRLQRLEIIPDTNQAAGFDAFVTTLQPEAMVDFLRSYRWLDGSRRMLAREIEFLRGAHGDPAIQRWLLIAPQIDAQATWELNGRDLSIVRRRRTQTGGRYGVFTEPRHKALAERLTGKDTSAQFGNRLTEELFEPRQGVVLLYPTRDPNTDPELLFEGTERAIRFATMGFSLLYPSNRIPQIIQFGVQDPSHPDDVVVQAT